MRNHLLHTAIFVCIIISNTALSQVLTVTAVSTDETACSACDGSATAFAFGGLPPYTYQWDDPLNQASMTAVGLCPGTYTVFVLDALFNFDSASVVVSPAVSTLSLSSSSIDETSCGACDGTASVNATGGTPPLAYLWNDPSNQTNTTAVGLCPGVYTVTVTDASTCQDSISATVGTSGGSGMTLSTSSSNNNLCALGCNGSSTVSIIGGTAPYTYAWSDLLSQTNTSATGLCGGTYNITVTDGSGCSEVGSATIQDSTDLAATLSFADESSCGACDGTATASASGGIPPYTYQWNDPSSQTTATATGLCAGTYDVFVIDSGSCVINESVIVGTTGGSGMTLTSSGVDASCGACDGVASVNVVGGSAPLIYSWNTVPIQTNATATALCPGTYIITVTDSNGCAEADTVVINGGNPFTLSANATDETACGAGDGTASVTIIGGTAPFTYLWDDPGNQTTDTATGLSAGTYTVIVTDAAGCMDSASATVNDPGTLIAFVSAFNNASCSACDGDASVTAILGTPPYTYLWDDPAAQTNSTATGLCAGTYTFVVTDGAACSASDIVTILQGAGPTALITSVNNATCGNCDGSASANVFGGTPPYTYLWDDPSAQTTSIADSLCPGVYTILIADADGCSDTAVATVGNIGGPAAIVSSTTNVSCNGGTDGSATVTAGGGAPPYIYLWDDPATQSTATATGLGAGTFNVTVTDTNNCVAIATALILEPAAISISFGSLDPSCPGGCDGSATAIVAGGISPYAYLWNDPLAQTTQTAISLCAGTYTVSVTDSNGCTSSATVVLTNPPGMTLTTSSLNATCGNGDGTASVSVTGGTFPYTYLWNDPATQTTSIATGLFAGTYSILVTDANGCTDSTNVNVNNIGGPSVAVTSSTDVSCNGGNDGSATASVAGGTPPYIYLWDDPLAQTNANATGLAAGTYNILVTDANSCAASASVIINEPALLFASIVSTTNASCNGTCDGSATASISGGVGPYLLQWSDGQNGATATGLCAETDTITVTDANGCTATAIATITEPVVLAVTTSVSDPICNGGCDGSASATVSGGTPPYLYLWDDLLLQTSSNATGLCAGTYTVNITDANSCTTSASVTLSDPAGMTLSTSAIDATCGNPDGSATVTVAGGTAPYAYLWDDPGAQTTFTANGLFASAYTVIVTDANGCMSTATVNVNNMGGPSATISGSSDVSCNGGSDGSATVTATGGTPPYTYLWDDPGLQMTATATGLSAGTYNANVADANGCIATASVVINEPTVLNAVITGSNNISCNGGNDGSATVAASGGVTPYSYQWNDPGLQVSSTATGLAAGTYTIVVTDANGCTAPTSVILTEPVALGITLTSTDPLCSGSCDGSAMANVTGGTLLYTYQWDDPLLQITQTVVGLCAGTYNVVVTDGNGCTNSASIIINDPPGLILSSSTVDATCGNSDGSATVNISGGTAPYAYQWDDPGLQTTATATGLSAGGYAVTVTDANGCTGTDNVNINNIGGPLATISSSVDVSCNGGSDGSATATTSAGTPPYSYLWDDPLSQTNANATGLAAGIYNVIVVDSNNCSASASVTVGEPTLLTSSISAFNNVTCNGACDGSATAAASGGIGPYGFLWSDGQNGATAVGLCAGSYTVTVTDANGCTSTAIVGINEPTALTLTTSATDPLCNGGCDGTASATTSGGTPPYNYQWNDPLLQTTASATGLCAGTYTIVITDGNGCNTSSLATINDPAGMSLIASVTDATCGQADGSSSVSATGGTAPYAYSWSSGGASSTESGLVAGGYSVTVTDANGCSTSINVNVNNVGGPVASISTSSDVLCNSGSDGDAAVSVTGGTTPYTYLWDDPSAQSTAAATGLAAGVYNVMVTDSNGCIASASVTINEPVDILLSVSSTNNVNCNGGSNGSAVVSVSGGTAPYAYLWDDPLSQTTSSANGLAAGTYSVTVIDANGCAASNSVTITEPTALSSTTAGTDPLCNGNCDGTATVMATGGTVPYAYQWNDPGFQVTATAIGLCAGTYDVTITDGNGCIATSSTVLTDPAGMTLTASTTDATCGNSDGSASVSATGGTSPFSYQWDDPSLQTNATVVGLAAGGYSVTVTDANGCASISSASVNDVGGPTVSISASTDATCGGCSDGSASASATGGSAPYVYSWNDPGLQTSATAIGLAAGTYTVLVTDTNGCSGVANVTINEPSNLNTAITSSTDATCVGSCDGKATVNVNGGTAPYIYQWDDPANQTTATAAGLCAGSYNVTVTDADGTSAVESVAIFQPSAILITSSSTDATCGSADGSATVTVTGGVPPYAYLWSSGGTVASESGLIAGNYTVTVTDDNGCSTVDNAVVNADNSGAPAITITSTNITCNGVCDGTATASLSGGTIPFSFLWDDPGTSTNGNALGLCVGTVTLIVTDGNGCIATDSITISEPNDLSAGIATSDATGGQCNGDMTATPSGGTTPYTYLWSDLTNQTSQTATGLCSGIYTVTVTDANGCTAVVGDTVGTILSIALFTDKIDWNIYPNPAHDFITVQVDLAESNEIEIKMYSVLGKLVHYSAMENLQSVNHKINLTEIPNGIYFINLATDAGSITEKIVINK